MRRVNYNASFSYGVAIKVLDSNRQLSTPALGQVTGVKLRLSLTPTGAAIDMNLNNLPASEVGTVPGEFAYDVSQALQQQYLKPLGPDVDFYAIWSNAAGFDCDYVHYRTADSTEVV